jgi:hypothetical protein
MKQRLRKMASVYNITEILEHMEKAIENSEIT